MEEREIKLKPVEKDSLYLKISDSIYNYIRMNNLQPGDKLPSERDMAAMLQTSRNSVREALRILEDRGLIYVKTGSGVFINTPDNGKSVLSVRLTDFTAKELQELQDTLEHKTILNAMVRGTPKQKQELLSLAMDMQEEYQNHIYSHTLDHGFHTKLYEMGGNSVIHQLIDKIRDDRFIRRESAASENNSVWLFTVPEHLKLAEAIIRQDTEAALRAIDTINTHGFSLISEDGGTP